jgi:hypothetical protein
MIVWVVNILLLLLLSSYDPAVQQIGLSMLDAGVKLQVCVNITTHEVLPDEACGDVK